MSQRLEQRAFVQAVRVVNPLRRLQRRKDRDGRVPGAPLTVVVEVASLRSGGLETVVRDLVLGLDRSRFRPVVACVEDAGPIAQQVEAGGVPVHVMGRRRHALEWVLESEGAQVLNSHYSLFGAASAAAMGVPQVHVLHNSYVWLDDGGARRVAWTYGHIDRFVAVSSSVAAYAQRRFGLGAVEVVPNGMALSRFFSPPPASRDEVRGEWQVGPGAFVFICVGRCEPWKGQLALLQAFARIAAQVPQAVLVLAGDLSDRDYGSRCEALVAAEGLGGRVRFTGFRPDVERLLAAADAYVQPSVVEGASLAAIQAAAAGLPLVLTEVGTARELADGPAAVTLVPGYLEDLAGATSREIQRASASPPAALVAALASALSEQVDAAPALRRRARDAAPQVVVRYRLESMVRGYERQFLEAASV